MAKNFGYIDILGRPWHLYGFMEAAENVAILDKASGLYLPPEELVTSSGAWQIGSTPRKTIEDERKVGLLIGTRGATEDIHDEVESAWWDGWSTERAGRFTASKGSGPYRWLDIRKSKNPPSEWSIAPDVNNFMEHDMELVACNPAWQAGMREDEQVVSGQRIFELTNPTDRPLWPIILGTPGATWEIQDGTTSRMVKMPALNQNWKLYTDPQVRTLEVENGPAVWPEAMRGVTFTDPIPPRTIYPIQFKIKGTGDIRIELIDQYSKPWG